VTERPAPLDDLPARYAEYLARVTAELGELATGAFAKYSGRLIKKLSFDEFTRAHLDHVELRARYQDSLERGDTINDLVIRLLREQAATLVLPAPRL
jgi:hypothetical protein